MTTTTDHGVNLDILTAEFPKEAIKQFTGRGKRSYSYVQGHSVINRLNRATGNHWDFQVMRLWQEGPVLYAHVRLELPGLGAREHIGVQIVEGGSGEDIAKGAVTDALKKAATLFGVALELYGDDYEADSEPREMTDAERKGIETRHVYNEILTAAQRTGVPIRDKMSFDQMCEAIRARGGTVPEKVVGDPLTSYTRILAVLKNMADRG